MRDILRPFWQAVRLSRAWGWWLDQWSDGWAHDHDEGEPCTVLCHPTRPSKDEPPRA